MQITPRILEPRERAHVSVVLFGTYDAAEVAERRKSSVRRRESSPDVLLLGFSKMRRDFLIQIAIDAARTDKCVDTPHEGP